MEFAIETNQITKRFGKVVAVDSVSLRVKSGEIYGFLGLNGAGKTTTIRSLLGMIHPDSGTARVLGEVIGPHGQGPWRRVGHLVEQPSAYPELTVLENLEVARRMQGKIDPHRTSVVIEKLGITPYINRKAGTLSTGNLQRLALARALLHEPELLILDEPANGLDLAGVVEIRELLRNLAQKQGVTVFMSSHILSEVDRLANRIGIIHKGKLIEELNTDQLERMEARYLVVKTRGNNIAEKIMKRAGYSVEREPGSIRVSDIRGIESPDVIARLLVNNNVPPTHLVVMQESLEEHFMKLTSIV